MTDKDLLTLAAKAAGIEGDMIGADLVRKEGDRIIFWNPLTDDGDALRLAVKIELFLCEDSVTCQLLYALNDPDPYAATRRAIVRAAAEIGKAMS